MAKSKKGGAFGFLRGRVGPVTYSILSAERSKSGKKEQIVRSLPDSVANPNSVGQILQRMKGKPASRFYAALETILSNAFEGVRYGGASRRYFMKKAMEMVGGPYIPKGVDRFIPAEYLMSEGSLNSFPLVRSQASDPLLHTSLTVDYTGGDNYTQQALADALGVSINTQISIVIVNNENGVFVPHFAGFDERITIADLPSAALVINQQPQFGNAAIQVASLGIAGLTMTNWVAACVILSVQDASGAWLRSTQKMVLNTQMYSDLYSTEAENAAIASYQDTIANNALTNPWYLNLGMNQAFDGRLIVGVPSDVALPEENAFARYCVIGKQVSEDNGQLTIERCVFATETTDNGLIIIVDGSVAKTDPALTVAAYRQALGTNAYTVKTWLNSYAAQAGLTWQGSAASSVSLYYRGVTVDEETINFICLPNGKIALFAANDGDGNTQGGMIVSDGQVNIDTSDVVDKYSITEATEVIVTNPTPIVYGSVPESYTISYNGTNITINGGVPQGATLVEYQG